MRIGKWGVLLVAVGVAGVAALASVNQLGDWDMFHHLAYGRDIVRRGGFAAQDPFLFPLAGVPSGPQPSWLGSVLIFLSWRWMGDGGPLVFAAILAATTFAVVFLDGDEGDDRAGAVVFTLLSLVLALALYRSRAVPRPELVANLLMVSLLAALRRAERVGWAWVPILGAGIPFWSNVHQSVLAGLFVVAMFSALEGGRTLLRAGSRGAEPARVLIAVLVGTLLGVVLTILATPVGSSPFETPLIVLRWATSRSGGSPAGGGTAATSAASTVEVFRAAINELQPMGRRWLGAFGALVATTTIASLAARRRPRPYELVVAVAITVLASRLFRLSAMAALVLAPICARSLRSAWDRIPVGRRRLRAALPVVAAVLAAYFGFAMVEQSNVRFGTGYSRRLPLRAVDYLRSIGFKGRIFDTFHFGGFLEWSLDDGVYQDGRGNVPEGEMEAALLGPASHETFQRLDEKYRFDALVVEYPSWEPSAVRQLSITRPRSDWVVDPDRWALVAFDDGALVYLRRDGRHGADALRDGFRHVRPALPVEIAMRDGPGAAEDLERSIRESPGCLRCRLLLGFVRLQEGRPDLARPLLEEARKGEGATGLAATYGLARLAVAQGDLAGAAVLLETVVRTAEQPQDARRDLAAVLADLGRVDEASRVIAPNLEDPLATRADLELGIEIARRRSDREAEVALGRRLSGAR